VADKKTVVITLAFEDGEKRLELDPASLPLIFLEALDDLKENNTAGWRKLRRGIRKMLHLTEAQSEELETEHLTLITQAIASAQAIPNG
jgi:hypothetical protein